MKRVYRTPKVKYINYSYDEQVVASSPGGDLGNIGDPNDVDLCQQMDATRCLVFWLDDVANTTCKMDPIPWSLR